MEQEMGEEEKRFLLLAPVDKKKSQPSDEQERNDQNKVLSPYGRDLVHMAREGKLPVDSNYRNRMTGKLLQQRIENLFLSIE